MIVVALWVGRRSLSAGSVATVIGAVVVWCTFGAGSPNGGSGAADTHLFRVEDGKIRYVHTITNLLQSSFRGGPTGTNADNAPRGGGPGAPRPPAPAPGGGNR